MRYFSRGYLVNLPILLVVVVVGAPPLVMGVLEWLCGKFPGLGRKLLLRRSRRRVGAGLGVWRR
jgi:hypothetical protein